MAEINGQGSVADASAGSLTSARVMDKYVNWIKQEFEPLTLAIPDDTIAQQVDNAIRYFNTHSGNKVIGTYPVDNRTKRIELPSSYKSVVQCEPTPDTLTVWQNHPLWSLTGITVVDRVGSDMMMLNEAFKNYMSYFGQTFNFYFTRGDNEGEASYLYFDNLPAGARSVYVTGTRRIISTEEIKDEYILEWILRYTKALIYIIEGNVLRKAGIIGVSNDGQALVTEGLAVKKEMQEELSVNGRWVSMARRF